jgi:general secretion pathway protein G
MGLSGTSSEVFRVRGFTLLELLVVVVIIGCSRASSRRYFGQWASRVGMAKAQIDALEKALDQYRLDTGRYPDNEAGLKALVTKPANEPEVVRAVPAQGHPA